MINENRIALEEREKEINNIVRSIQDLNEIFRDLATMIVGLFKIRNKTNK